MKPSLRYRDKKRSVTEKSDGPTEDGGLGPFEMSMLFADVIHRVSRSHNVVFMAYLVETMEEWFRDCPAEYQDDWSRMIAAARSIISIEKEGLQRINEKALKIEAMISAEEQRIGREMTPDEKAKFLIATISGLVNPSR